jgi:plastocyanin
MVITFTTGLAALLCLVAIPSTRAVDIDVVVGGTGILAFQPEFVTAAVGDVVKFSFRQKNHTATQSSLASPCAKLPGGFDSGYVPVAASNTAGPFPVALYTVTSLDPVWVYCQQGTHCSGAGMVFAVNPGSQFAQFKAAATGAPPATTATTSATTSAAAAPTATGSTNHRVVVGGPGLLAYTPNNIKANPGDSVTFEFRQKNHTVTQSTFANPCRALTLTSTTGQVGLDSGFMPVPDGSVSYPEWTVPINDTAPLWFYCKQGNHCGQGMVLAINSVDSGPNSFSAFQAKAKELNGTATGPTPTSTSGAFRVGAGSGLVLAIFGVVTGLIL